MAEVISRSGKEVKVAVTVRLAGSLWEMEEAIQAATNAVGCCASDAVVVGPMYDVKVAVESRCQVTVEPIRIQQQGRRVLSAEPSDDVRVGVRWQQPGACAAHSMCSESP